MFAGLNKSQSCGALYRPVFKRSVASAGGGRGGGKRAVALISEAQWFHGEQVIVDVDVSVVVFEWLANNPSNIEAWRKMERGGLRERQ